MENQAGNKMNTGKELGRGSENSDENIFDEMNRESPEGHSTPDTGDSTNYLREKTFTPELKNLIDQVTHHEPGHPGEDDSDISSEEEIIKRMHRLFYRAINLVNVDKINKTFNPFDIDSVLSDETIIRIIHDKMTGIGFHNYTLMPYHTGKRCFLPSVNHVKELDIHNVYIDSNDALYAMIMENSEGIVLTREVINYDPLLHKRFSPPTALEENTYYLNSLKKIHGDLSSEIYPSRVSVSEDSDFTPIIMIEIKNGTPSSDVSSIYRKLKNSITVYTLFYTCLQSMKMRRAELKGYQQYFKAMEYYFRLIARNKNGRCYLMRFEKFYSEESHSLKSFFLAGLYKNLSGKSLIIDPDQHRILVVSDTIDAAFMEKALQDWSGLFKGEFSYEVHEDPGKAGFSGFLKNMVFK